MDEALDTALLRIARAVLGAQELTTIIANALETFAKLVPAWRHSIGLIDERAGTYTIYAFRGSADAAWTLGEPVPLSEFGGDLDQLRCGRPQFDRDLRRADPQRAGRMQALAAQLLAPVIHGERLLATLNVGALEVGQLDDAHVEIAAQVGDLLGQALRQHELQRELARAHADALEASRSKSAFLATISHEIRTPLNAILGLSELLARRLDDAPGGELVHTIHESARGLLGLINDVLDFSKGAAGELALELTPVDLRALIASTLRMFELAAGDRDVGLWSDVDPRLPARIEGDELRLRQVLLNLLSNAIKFTARGSVGVRVRVEGVAPMWLALAVVDTGEGVAAEAQARIFDPFVQAEPSVARRSGGTGLGLAICKQIAEAMAGTMTLESAPGRGSTFTLRAPVRARPDATTATTATTATQPASAEPLPRWRVLVVDDNSVNRIVAEAMFVEAGQSVIVASGGAEAMDQLARDRFDIVFMDCVMPELDGYEATRRIRAGEAGPGARGVPIVALTANALPEDRAAARSAGMDDYMTKPITRAAIVDALRRNLPPTASG